MNKIKQEILKILPDYLEELDSFAWPGFFYDLEVQKADSQMIEEMRKYVRTWDKSTGESNGNKLLREALGLPSNFDFELFRDMDDFDLEGLRRQQA